MTATTDSTPPGTTVNYTVEPQGDGEDLLVSVQDELNSDDLLSLVDYLRDQHDRHYVRYLAFTNGDEQFILTNAAR